MEGIGCELPSLHPATPAAAAAAAAWLWLVGSRWLLACLGLPVFRGDDAKQKVAFLYRCCVVTWL
jgi:hypothetical protein